MIKKSFTFHLKYRSVRFQRGVVDSASSTGLFINIRPLCDFFEDLNPRQHDICLKKLELMGSVQDGADLAKKECAKQFKNERWNCSITEKSELLKRMTKLGKE